MPACEKPRVSRGDHFYGEVKEELMEETEQTEYELLSEEELQKLYDNEEER